MDNLSGDKSRIEWLEEEIAIHQRQVEYYTRLLNEQKELETCQ